MGKRRGYPASVIARLGGVDLSALLVRLGLTDPDLVPVQPAPAWLARAWRGDVVAMTLPWAIYIKRQVLSGDAPALGRLVKHELVHVKQWQNLGITRFLLTYIRDYFRGRLQRLNHNQAYLAISLEKEAREISGA